jgi:uncharacterized membrane protein
MKPLIVLLITFVISVTILKILRGNYQTALAGRIAMAVMLIFTASGHFVFPQGMSMMIPEFIPFKTELVYVTGIIEILAAGGLLISRLKRLTGILLIIFFVLVLPANIHAAINHVDYQNATLSGAGAGYLWFRIPLQGLFIVWTYLCAVKN